jgi:hypothetical protein
MLPLIKITWLRSNGRPDIFLWRCIPSLMLSSTLPLGLRAGLGNNGPRVPIVRSFAFAPSMMPSLGLIVIVNRILRIVREVA